MDAGIGFSLQCSEDGGCGDYHVCLDIKCHSRLPTWVSSREKKCVSRKILQIEDLMLKGYLGYCVAALQYSAYSSIFPF